MDITSIELTAEQCRWTCDPKTLGFDSTAELSPEHRIMGQDEAVEALRFGLRTRFTGNNIFVRSLSGFGRMALIHQVIDETTLPVDKLLDRCFVHNFSAPDRPGVLALPPGRGQEFCDAMKNFASFVSQDLPAFLSSDVIQSRQKQMFAAMQTEIKSLGGPFEVELKDAGLAMVPVQMGNNTVPVIMPVIDGETVGGEELQAKRLSGDVTEDEFNQIIEKTQRYQQKVAELGEAVTNIQMQHQGNIQRFMAEEARRHVESRLKIVSQRFQLDRVGKYLDDILVDLMERFSTGTATEENTKLYEVNLVSKHDAANKVPVVTVPNPTIINLIGTIDSEPVQGGFGVRTDHMMIKPGAILEADGGFLIIDAREVVSEPGAWSVLLRTLKTGQFDMSMLDASMPFQAQRLKPELIPIDIKVILVGDPDTYYLLDQYEPRFADMFKVLADFGDTIQRDVDGFSTYASMLARLSAQDSVAHFRADAVAKLIEHGARICAQHERLTSRFSRIADLAREGAFIAGEGGAEEVSGVHIVDSIRRSKRRADLPARRFRRMIAERSIQISVDGKVVGQINGLAVTSAGPLTYGFPSRITASIGPGSAGLVNVERESNLSGSVHTKGFLIINGLLRHLLMLDHPLAFSASLAFEQSYGGIDGDSASAAELCCLLSALTDLPIRQDLAMTGAVDQKGNMLPIGAVTEKVEGFYDACQSVGFTGTQGVIVPSSNAQELMLREDVVQAISTGEFHVYAIDRIEQALYLFLEKDVGDRLQSASDTVLAIARERAHQYWETMSRRPGTKVD